MKILLLNATTIASLILSPIWRSYVLVKLWAWFIVTTFALAPLTIPQALGLSLMVIMLTHQYDPYEDEDQTATASVIKTSCIAFTWPLLALFIGAVIKLWM